MNKDKEKFLKLYKKYYSGELSMNEYAKEIGYTKPTIYKYLTKFCLKKRNKRFLD